MNYFFKQFEQLVALISALLIGKSFQKIKNGAILGLFAFCGFLIFSPVAAVVWNELRSKSSFSVEAWATTLSAGFILYVTATISGWAIMAD